MNKGSFRILKGDLFTVTNQPLCHCVSQDYAMGAGIAVSFEKIFGRPEKQVKIGEIAITKNKADQIAINMVTKEKYWHKPTLKSLRTCLEAVKKYCLENNIDAISMPQIGCGLDKLNWKTEVEPSIKEILKDIHVTIYILK